MVHGGYNFQIGYNILISFIFAKFLIFNKVFPESWMQYSIES